MVTQYKVGDKVFLRDARKENLPPHSVINWSSPLACVVGFPATIIEIDVSDASARIEVQGLSGAKWVSLDWISSLETVADSPVIEEINNDSLFW